MLGDVGWWVGWVWLSAMGGLGEVGCGLSGLCEVG